VESVACARNREQLIFLGLITSYTYKQYSRQYYRITRYESQKAIDLL
jgi:hypothetical protein